MKGGRFWSCVLSLACAACFPEPSGLVDGTKDGGSGEGGSAGGDAGSGGHAGSGAGGDSAGGSAGTGASGGSGGALPTCKRARSSDNIPAREAAMSGTTNDEEDQFMLVDELFGKFYNQCGACHVDQPVAFTTSRAAFVSDFDPSWIERIRSDSETGSTPFMPPKNAGGMPYSERGPSDPIVRLAELLELWDKAGRPPDLFRLKKGEGSSGASYVLTRDVGERLTNIGNCIPSAKEFGIDKERMRELDRVFEKLEKLSDLPARLKDTDLTSFDSKELARQGIVAYAPNYPLFSDHAKKLRHIRTPLGTSMHYDEKTREFVIPDNTRVYKTFLKEVIDESGKPRFRKIETRIIVTRRDAHDGVDGVRALYGSYVWNEAETEAVLHADRLRNGEPFTDLVFSYILDEPKVKAILEELDPDLDIPGILRNQGLTRTYAIPSSQRCVECHMGSRSESFLVGITPLSAARRLPGEGGTIVEPGEDELTQLERYIDYGVVTGLDSADDVVRLETSQGDTRARSDLEERAQGYMVGNCAYCHNPRGFPSQTKPELTSVLDFWPREKNGKQEGGIFQFPLERYSPRVVRNGSEPVPYITPSLHSAGAPKVVTVKIEFPDGTIDGREVPILAPWRSLIYRNVDTPFTYAEDRALFQHMPRNVAGFDCEAPTIFGEWMVSIPAKPKSPKVPPELHTEAQPYTEVREGDEGFTLHSTLARQRLSEYRAGLRSQEYYCPNTADTVDPVVLHTPGELTPKDASSAPSRGDAVTSDDPYLQALSGFLDRVPDHVHWITSDLTNPPLTDWYPRRGDWKEQLVDGELAKDPKAQVVAGVLETLVLEADYRAFALEPVPTSIWVKKDDCDFSEQTMLGELADPPLWVGAAISAGKALNDDFAYVQPRGEMLFREICAHCHGEAADSRGLQAQTVLELTGGVSRVADFKAGLFGPSTEPGKYREKAFSEVAGGHDTWGPRYLAWMALGGTNSVIPPLVLDMVGDTPVLGELRRDNPAPDGGYSANMLEIAKNLCLAALPDKARPFVLERGMVDFDPEASGFAASALIDRNYDLELWLDVCTWKNPAPVRMLTVTGGKWTDGTPELRVEGANGRYRRDRYPSAAPVGQGTGGVAAELNADNHWPWCVVLPADESERALAEAYLTEALGGGPAPFCPLEFREEAVDAQRETSPYYAEFQALLETWATRGAANGGLLVYSYLDAMLGGEIASTPAPTSCEALAETPVSRR